MRACVRVCVNGAEGVLIFGDILILGQNVFKTKKRITISIGFSTLLISVIVKVMFKLMKQVTLGKYVSFNLLPSRQLLVQS